MISEMSVEIIPAIIAKDFNELKEKVELVEPYVKWVQIDVMDGNFVPNKTWNNPEDLRKYTPQVSLEAHLMISEPEKYAEKWIDAGIKRIIFHIEATSRPQDVIKICKEKGVQVGVAINPETQVDAIEGLLGQNPVNGVDMVLILGVNPGLGGQEFKPSVLEKIKALRHSHPHLTIGVDGGMNPKTAKNAVEAGANVIVAGSYIFSHVDIKKAIAELKNAWQS